MISSPARNRTKIVATVGPACDSVEMLTKLIEHGVNVFRINTAHGDRLTHERAVANIREASVRTGRVVGILVDLAGPKIRLGELFENPTECQPGERFRFVRGERSSAANELTSNYERLIDELKPGDRVMLADGLVSMNVVEKNDDGAVCEVTSSGTIRSRQGINLPGAELSVPALTDEDLKHASWAADLELDFLGLSFVRCAADIERLRAALADHPAAPFIVAKIEKSESLDDLDAIVSASDGVMVARGDLGVEIDVAETPVAQKRIIETCRRFEKPVIVATQMLESMHHSRRPTRAEVSDVANAILDGADACMLSGETAIGDYPCEVVDTMRRIMEHTEPMLKKRTVPRRPETSGAVLPITSAVVYGASQIADQLEAKLLVIATRTGGTAQSAAMRRSRILTIGLSNNSRTLRRMCLLWGIMPLAGVPVDNPPELRRLIEQWGQDAKLLENGDHVVYVTGTGMVQRAHNLIVVHQVSGLN
ncbi:MAG: pyruvate kinase [Pirellulaceae bacterium]